MTGSARNNNKANETEEHFDVPKDWRSEQKAGEYPDYMSYKSRSGHNFVLDDTKDHETVTLQHRGGSAIQMRPDGSVHITAHNSLYTVVFAENRMTVTGAQDITVKGDASLRVYGDYNVTVHKNYNLTVLGDFNLTSKNHNRHIRGNIDTQAKNETKKLEGSSAKLAKGGIGYVSQGSIGMTSLEGHSYIGGAKGAHMAVTKEGSMTFKNEKGDTFMENADGKFDGKFAQGGKTVSMLFENGELHAQSEEKMNIESKNSKISVKAQQDVGIESTSGGVEAKASSGNIKIDAGQDLQAKAGQSASLEGSTTHVSGQTVHVVGSTTTHVEGSSALNLNGGLGQLFSGSLSFNFDQIAEASGIGSRSSPQANQPQEEADHEQEIRNWV